MNANEVRAKRAYRITLTLAVVVAAFGCASGLPAGQSGDADSYVGYVRFVGEFVLYDDRSAFAHFRKEHCVSGALPLDKQREAAKRFDGKRVRVTGTRVPWSLPGPLAVSLNHEGSPITNWCGGQYVLFATDMVIE
jgi:hypothetical protein